MYATGDYKTALKPAMIGLIMCLAIIVPAHADLVSGILNIGSPVYADEHLEYMNSTEYLKSQWKVSNFTYSENITEFWVTNYKSPDISLSEIVVKDYDSGETVSYNYTKKTTVDGGDTASIWNLFGILNPGSKLVSNETCQIRADKVMRNITITYQDITSTHWEGKPHAE
jgi:hypothetical protein